VAFNAVMKNNIVFFLDPTLQVLSYHDTVIFMLKNFKTDLYKFLTEEKPNFKNSETLEENLKKNVKIFT
jgi:hypothetical protein